MLAGECLILIVPMDVVVPVIRSEHVRRLPNLNCLVRLRVVIDFDVSPICHIVTCIAVVFVDMATLALQRQPMFVVLAASTKTVIA